MHAHLHLRQALVSIDLAAPQRPVDGAGRSDLVIKNTLAASSPPAGSGWLACGGLALIGLPKYSEKPDIDHSRQSESRVHLHRVDALGPELRAGAA